MEQKQAALIKIEKKFATKVERAKALIKILLILDDETLNDTQISILSYFMVYGANRKTKTLIVDSGICSKIAHINTAMVILKKKEYIYKDDLNGKVYVSPSLKIENEIIGLYTKLSIIEH